MCLNGSAGTGDFAVLASFGAVVDDDGSRLKPVFVASTECPRGPLAEASQTDRTASQAGSTGLSVCGDSWVDLYSKWKIQLQHSHHYAGRKRAGLPGRTEIVRGNVVHGSGGDSWGGFASHHVGL